MWFRSACVALVISVMELRAGARGWVVACTLGIGASLVLVRRGVPTESAVDMWAIVCGVALGDLEGEHKSMTGFVTGVASVGSAGRGDQWGHLWVCWLPYLGLPPEVWRADISR